jgi:polysaccharide biosynthesis protein PslG
VQPVGGRPTEAGLRMGRLKRWLDGARIGSCGEGRRMGLAEGAYTCRFVREGKPLVVVWTTRGRSQVTLDEDALRMRRMDGSTVRARPGERVGFGEEPLLIEYRKE